MICPILITHLKPFFHLSTPPCLHSHALLLLGHGSSKHPDSSASVRKHADLLRARESFTEVHCAFLKEEPRIENALAQIQSERITIVPDFLAEGYFTEQIIPELLGGLPSHITLTSPVGIHPLMQELILQVADETLSNWKPEETSLLVVGHGSNKNNHSKQTLLDHIAAMESSFAQVTDLWLEEPPYVSDWKKTATQKQIIAVPYLLSNGQHGGWDIPKMLGNIPNLRLAPALGTNPRFVQAIADIANCVEGTTDLTH